MTLEFELYCENSWKKGLLGTSLFLCTTISTFIMGYVSTYTGTYYGCLICLLLGSLGTVFVS